MTDHVGQEAKPKELLGKIRAKIVAQIRQCPICKTPLDRDGEGSCCPSCGVRNKLRRVPCENIFDAEYPKMECRRPPGIWVHVDGKRYWVCHICISVFEPGSSYIVKFEVCEEGMFGGLYRSTKSQTFTKYRYVGRVDEY